MTKITRKLPWLALMALAMITTPRANTAPPAERHPHIRGALRELREARRELETAAHDFCGHRAAAVRQVEATIEQLRLALECDRR